MMTLTKKIEALKAKGVSIPHPESVYIDDAVDVAKISASGVCVHPFTKILGAKTFISAGVQIGEEAPTTIENCGIDEGVSLKGGSFRESLFLAGAFVGTGAQVRECCILEEASSCAHSVGLKQTILFPFVTLGSLINFCDCLMAGGTSRNNHSEVGSSYIHFNFTPHQDKATASLIGDVPAGVMLGSEPIFLGGQGGLVGPMKVGYGTIIGAGKIHRYLSGYFNERGEEKSSDGKQKFYPCVYPQFERIFYNNIEYMANLVALREWYRRVRAIFTQKKEYGAEISQMADAIIVLAVAERVKRLCDFLDKAAAGLQFHAHLLSSEKIQQQKEIVSCKDDIREYFDTLTASIGENKKGDDFVKMIALLSQQQDYLGTIKMLNEQTRNAGTLWLSDIVTKLVEDISRMLQPKQR